MKRFVAKIQITLRAGILDVQGKAVEHALHSIGYRSISDVRIGKYVTAAVEAESEAAAGSIVDEACKKLIANPIIEDYKITLEETSNE